MMDRRDFVGCDDVGKKGSNDQLVSSGVDYRLVFRG